MTTDVFCRIVAGDAPAFEVLRTGTLVAFLDTRPLFPGHTLLVPTVHVQTYAELPPELAREWVDTSQRLERAVESAMGADGSMILMNNVVSQSVPHLHLHVIPRSKGDGLRFWLGPRRPYRTDAEAQATADGIRRVLSGLS
ncbi:MAG: HIT family protein [Microbacteriaceae bacterium]|nr:MAG: HIT family protein [Microbacteriaceae bacterium]